MCLCLHNYPRFTISLQRVITTLFNYHTGAVATNRHNHHFGFIALIVIEPLNGTSVDADNRLAGVRMTVGSRLRRRQQHVDIRLPRTRLGRVQTNLALLSLLPRFSILCPSSSSLSRRS